MKTKILLLMILLLLITGCTLRKQSEPTPPPQNGDRLPEPGLKTRETVFYLPDQDWRVLVPVRIHIPWEEGIARATVGYLTEGNLPAQAMDTGLIPLLPAGTEVLGLAIRDGLARIDLSSSFLDYNPEDERMVINGLVYTLTEFPTITDVEILVEGEKAEFPGMTTTGVFGREFGVNLEVAEGLDDFSQTDRITLYFLLPAGENVFYVPVTRVIPEPEDRVFTVIEELLKGPAFSNILMTSLSAGVTLESTRVQGGKVTVHFSGDLTSGGGGQLAADRIRHQLALTLTEITGITEVEVLVDGQQPTFPPGVQFPETFTRPKLWNLIDSTQ
ncbi:MAG: GerMN domain-containing protein [Bacillota bacterium]|nr:GerMN domain-containing protein [Bacillota bacterium]MDW7683351.1 GerMN domain-containing protein [Bacillota bacterium]